MVPKWCLNAKMYDLLPLLWSLSGAPMLKMYDLLPLLWPRSWCPNSKMYDLLPSLWPRSGAPMLGCAICCRCFGLPMLRCAICCRCFGLEVVPGAKMYDLLPLLWSRSNDNHLLLLLCCLEVVPQCEDIRFVAFGCCWDGLEVVPRSGKMYNARRCAPTIYDLLPLLWFPAVPQFEDV